MQNILWSARLAIRLMSRKTSALSISKDGNILVQIHAKPGAKQNQITDISTDCIGIQIAAPAKEGEANTELLSFIKFVLKVRKSELSLERGGKSRIKTIKITTCKYTLEDIQNIFEKEIKS